jgi:hypothetical protein
MFGSVCDNAECRMVEERDATVECSFGNTTIEATTGNGADWIQFL